VDGLLREIEATVVKRAISRPWVLSRCRRIASLATPIAVALVGFWISFRLRKHDLRIDQAKAERRREHTPHVEMKLDCQFHGFRDGNHLTTFTVSIANVGLIMPQLPKIVIRVRGIKDEPFGYLNTEGAFDPGGRRACFPYKILEGSLVPAQWNFVFVEPGVTQDLCLTTLVPGDFSYLMANVTFYYTEDWPHTAEEVFAVPPAREPVG
jgi:hypothetical protein